jgi:hypothetical protein
MTEDNTKDSQSKPVPPVGVPPATKKPPAKSAAKGTGGKPAEIKKPVIKEDDLYPSDEEEEDEIDEDSPELFGDEPGSDLEADTLPDVILGATDTSERIILVVDEDGQRRNETVAIISQILPNAVIEVADDPEEALGMMDEGDFDTFVVNFLMPGYSSSPFVKAVANHPEHPLLIGFAADKMSDAVDPKKGLKIIPLKRLFDLDVSNSTEPPDAEPAED